MNKISTSYRVVLFFVFGFSQLHAQVSSSNRSNKGKQSYIITKAGNPTDCEVCDAAFSKIVIDKYRYADERREIKLVDQSGNTLYDVTLLSGEELQKKYGKQISPLNIIHSQGSSGCELLLLPSGDLKVKSCK